MNKTLKMDLDRTSCALESFVYDFENLQSSIRSHGSEAARKEMRMMMDEISIISTRMNQLIRTCM